MFFDTLPSVPRVAKVWPALTMAKKMAPPKATTACFRINSRHNPPTARLDAIRQPMTKLETVSWMRSHGRRSPLHSLIRVLNEDKLVMMYQIDIT